MLYNFKDLRPHASHPPYPPYHTGSYIEEYFYSYYITHKAKFDKTGKTLIPIFWTNLYLSNFPNHIIQQYVNILPAGKQYFTVSQFDDGISQKLPNNTINFVAGGNMKGVPIPLICSPIPQKYMKEQERDILCSFVGTYVDSEKYECRKKLYQEYYNDKDFYFTPLRNWERIVTEDRFTEFTNITQRSVFTLCPRGYGLSSFRLYEAIQLGSIPVFVYDEEFFPFNDVLNWDEFCILVHKSEITDLKRKLESYSKFDIQRLQSKGKTVYNNFFTLEKTCENILRILKNNTNEI